MEIGKIFLLFTRNDFVKKDRPVNLNLMTIRFPLIAFVSGFHRIAGLFLFLLLPFILWVLQQSLASPESFQALRLFTHNIIVKLLLWGFLCALIYHVIAGIRHLLMDLEIGDSLQAGRRSGTVVLVASFLLMIIAGIWLW